MSVIAFLLLLSLMCVVWLLSLYFAIRPSKKRYGYHGGGATEHRTNTSEKNPFLRENKEIVKTKGYHDVEEFYPDNDPK